LASVSIAGEGSLNVNEWNWVAPRKITLPGGTVSEMSHDGLLKLTGLTVKSPGQQTILALANRFGLGEELREKVVTDSSAAGSSTVAHSYGYDSEQRLTQVTRDTGGLFGQNTETFAFDAVGNRTAHSTVNGSFVYDANNRLVQRGEGPQALSYQYDSTGALTQIAQGTGATASPVRRHVYDAFNRLIEVQDGAGTVVARYEYDPFDIRLSKTIYVGVDGQALASPVQTLYLHSDEGLIAEADDQAQVHTLYGWRPDGVWGNDPLFIRTVTRNEAGTAAEPAYAYFHNDQLGTPLRASNKAGEVVWRAEHNSLGAASVSSDSRLTNHLRQAGQYFDAETGLHYNNRRYYDPVPGRYITPDPLGVAGGWNLYDYANGDPTNQIDPTGEWVWLVIRVAITVYDVYTTYQEIKENGLCADWTRLIPIPIKVPKVKWLN